MTGIVTLITDGFADWETAMLNASARTYYGVDTLFASPGGRPVISMAGLKATPDLALEDLSPAHADALVIAGGTIWQTADAPDIAAIAAAFHRSGKVVAGICDGTLALARAGLLDTAAHTSNGVGYLASSGYKGEALYRDQPGAVRDQRLVTASFSAPVSFAVAVLEELGVADDQLRYFAGLHGAQHGKIGLA